MVVGVSTRDVKGATSAVQKAIQMSHAGDEIIAIHIPKLTPEMMLTSLTSSSNPAAMLDGPSKAREIMEEQIKEVALHELKVSGKEVDIMYKMTAPSDDCKTSLLEACKAEKADVLFIGPGAGGNGSVPPFAVMSAKGLTVCVVR